MPVYVISLVMCLVNGDVKVVTFLIFCKRMCYTFEQFPIKNEDDFTQPPDRIGLDSRTWNPGNLSF